MAISKLVPVKPSKGPSCEVCSALATLPPDEAEALRDHMRNPQWRYTALSEALAADEDTPLELGDKALSRHARGQCAAKERLRSRR